MGREGEAAMARTITSLTGFVRKIRDVRPDEDEVLLYRGHPKSTYKLLPSVLREPDLANAEHAMLRELVATHPAEFASDTTALEQLARAQHYSLPTRLLDTTWNPLVALYFASSEHAGTTGEVVVFRVNSAQIAFGLHVQAYGFGYCGLEALGYPCSPGVAVGVDAKVIVGLVKPVANVVQQASGDQRVAGSLGLSGAGG